MSKMRIAVCVKQTVDKDINPFDACALEEALKIKSNAPTGEVEVVIVSMGPKSTLELLSRLSRLGADRGILLTDPCLAGSDTLATAYALSLVMKKLMPDVVFCGRQSIDGDTAQVGPELACACGFKLITNVMSIDSIKEGMVECSTRFGVESATFPTLLTIERINSLRFPRLGSKVREAEVWNATDIGADPSRCGLKGSPTRVLKTFESSLGKRKCSFITPGELFEIAKMQAQKEIVTQIKAETENKLPLVWCVGEKPIEKAKAIAQSIKVIDESKSPEEIVSLARDEKPSVILWSSDFFGRRNAPQVAYALSAGLCADCTALETDGEKLFMYRPAFSGSIMAKIECNTLPQMATVRCTDEASEKIMLCAGLGALPYLDKLQSMAKQNGYGFGATRALVDRAGLPYEYQIGLTGRSVCPRVYIGFGVSGAVQHTCAIEQAGTVIAVNSDKSARIFEFSDYGVICDIAEIL